MELKKYQKQVIADLKNFMHFYAVTDAAESYSKHWETKNIAVGTPEIPAYQDLISGVPNVCFKVPTGGGKTFLACNAIKIIADALPLAHPQAVVWLVPSDSIREQTLKALKDQTHPYRQRLDLDFGSRVEVYSKEELLNGQNFSPTNISDQLTVMVLSYDSFRGKSKEALKAFQPNGNLAPFRSAFANENSGLDEVDDTALFSVINKLNPIVVVDESHHARSALSLEMLKNFNPAFVLDLTATPKKQSNIISYVDAYQLKQENMVKVPVIAYNKNSQKEVIADTIDLRNSLEKIAIEEEKETGRYIRPIALLQAQPKGKEDATSFEKLREKLVQAGIPEEQIAIKTANINEIKNIDLLSRTCPIRYIITVNALKEGWDCSFAYVLASLANRTSEVDVEQIIGRILRLPGAQKNKNTVLNLSYVLASSADFQKTVNNILRGLNDAGFSSADYRIGEDVATDLSPDKDIKPVSEPLWKESSDDSFELEQEESEEFLGFTTEDLAESLNAREVSDIAVSGVQVSENATSMLRKAEDFGEEYEQEVSTEQNSVKANIPSDLRDKVNTSKINQEFISDAEITVLPQFVVPSESSLFNVGEDETELLTPEALTEEFKLRGKDSTLQLESIREEAIQFDVREGNRVERSLLSAQQNAMLKRYLANSSIEGKKYHFAERISEYLNRKFDAVSSTEIKAFTEAAINNLEQDQIQFVEEHFQSVTRQMEDKVRGYLDEHRRQRFDLWTETAQIKLEYQPLLPVEITLYGHPAGSLAKSLYEVENSMNSLESDMAMELGILDNVLWWHRNSEHGGYKLNGFINHYPDLIVKTMSGRIILVETKGSHLKNTEDTHNKIHLGNAWSKLAGDKYRYYMVVADGEAPPTGAKTKSEVLQIISAL